MIACEEGGVPKRLLGLLGSAKEKHWGGVL
jgi:hypothetical protein